MSSEAEAAFWAHAEKVQADYLSLRLSEADTRSYLIDPVLRLLGYEGVKHLRREMPVPATKEAIDYELLVDGKAHAIVEAKAIRHQITAQDAAQAVQYASVLGVRWCLITNGLHWALYDAHANIPLAEKRVAEVRLDGDPTVVAHAWAVLSLFSREAVASTSPLTSLLIERVLADELQAPDSKAVAELRRAVTRRFGERVAGGAVVDAIQRWRQRGSAQAAAPVMGEVGKDEETVPSPSPRKPPPQRDRRRRVEAGTRTRLADLIDAGLLPTDAVLEAQVHGVSHFARVRDGSIEWGGRSTTRHPAPRSPCGRHRGTAGWTGISRARASLTFVINCEPGSRGNGPSPRKATRWRHRLSLHDSPIVMLVRGTSPLAQAGFMLARRVPGVSCRRGSYREIGRDYMGVR